MLRKCTKYIFLLLFALLIIPSSIYPANSQENVTNNTLTTNTINYTYQSSYSSSYTSSTSTSTTDDPGYTITNYNVDIIVGEDNVFHIVEDITCYFVEYRHGIYRNIPLVNDLIREDGSSDKQIAKVSNVDVNTIYSDSRSQGVLQLKIGSTTTKVIGERTYTISYDYQLSKDNHKDFDELYFNIIGSEWTTIIEKVTFSIEMPKAFDSSLLGFSKGYTGSSGYSNIEYGVDNNTITGYTTEALSAYQALTVRMELPENYFSKAKNIGLIYIIIGIGIPLLALAIVIGIFVVCRRKHRFVPTVEFYPPKGMNSLDVALIYKTKVDNKDVISLLVYLASKGYIRIEEDERGNKVKVTKLREYNGGNQQESSFMDALFADGDSLYLSSLDRNTFPTKITNITSDVNNRNNTSAYFDSKVKKLKVLSIILSIVALLAPGCTLVAFEGFAMLATYVFPIVAVIWLGTLIRKTKSIGIALFALVWGGAPWAMIAYSTYAYGIIFAINVVLGGVIAVIIAILANHITARNENGAKLYAHILGFRQFIKTAEKERLEKLCEQNPSYFYDIIPYAYVLGVSNVWIKKFEDIAVPEVDYYVCVSGSRFRITTINSVFTTVSRMSTPYSHSSSSSSHSGGGGGGFSGGGFSGGGSGGGGGRSW